MYTEPQTELLLAFKPMVMATDLSFRSANTIDIIWPPDQVVTSPCDQHEDPEDGCTCGIVSTFDTSKAYKFMQTEVENQEYMPILAVIQVLGKTVVDNENKLLRSWGGFLWGVVQPPHLSAKLMDLMFVGGAGYLSPLFLTYNPVRYRNLRDAWVHVEQSLQRYGVI